MTVGGWQKEKKKRYYFVERTDDLSPAVPHCNPKAVALHRGKHKEEANTPATHEIINVSMAFQSATAVH